MSTILTFDSGVGGLTVLRHLRQALPGASHVYVADNAGFPYGAWEAEALAARVIRLFEMLIARFEPDLAVIACNTASTLVLPPLRARFPMPFVGTVPAIKPAAEQTRSGLVSVLATQATVKRDYTHGLIEQFARSCEVTLVPCARLARLAEDKLAGRDIDIAVLREEITPAFVQRNGRRSDQMVLACTHYPLLLDELERHAPWPVSWIDPAPAIARRAAQVLAEAGRTVAGGEGETLALFTDADSVDVSLLRALRADHAIGHVGALPLDAFNV